MAAADRAMQAGAAVLADRRAGQKSLFDDFDDVDEQDQQVTLPDLPELDERERLLMEKEVLGFYLSSHPLAEYQRTLATYCSHTTAELGDLPDRTEVLMGGMLSAIKPAHVRKPRDPNAATKYVNFDLEDMDGAVRCILWPDDYVNHGHLVQPDAILVARGVVDRRGGSDEVNLIVNELIPLDELDSRYTQGVLIRVDEDVHGEGGVKQLHEIVRGYPGDRQLQLVLQLANGTRVVVTSQNTRVALDPEMRQRVDDLLGSGNFRLLIAPPRVKTNGRRHAATS